MSVSILTSAGLYRQIELCQSIFKYNGKRMTLLDPKSRPFRDMSPDEIISFLTLIIEKAGSRVCRVVSPGQQDARSSKFPTFVTCSESGSLIPIVFGYAHSSAEEIQVSEIARAMQRVADSRGTTRVWDGQSFVAVNGVIRKGGSREKADAIMHFNGEPRISISLKNLATGKASEMQGWSGVTRFSGVKSLVDFADATCAVGSPRCWRPISEITIKHDACWGLGADQVDVIVAGSGLDLVEDGTGYRICAKTLGGIWYRCDGRVPDGDFEPVLFCRPSSDHSITTTGGRVSGVRMMIAPIAHARASSRSIEV